MPLLKMKEQLAPERITLHSPRGPLSHISLVPTNEQGYVHAVNVVLENKKSTAASKPQRDQQFGENCPHLCLFNTLPNVSIKMQVWCCVLNNTFTTFCAE